MVDDGAAGDESSTGNSDAGDDDHDDDDRGDAVAAHADDDDAHDDDGVIPDGYSLVQPLSVQVAAALETIARIDADDGPVCYVWDVTLYRPGVYADGQPAEAVWHLVVDSAHAFDPVWQRAVDAIASRLLYVEPDATPPGLDDLLGALRRARVRDADALFDDIAVESGEAALIGRLGCDRLLGMLPGPQAAAIRAVKIEGLSVIEAAARLGQSESMIKVNVHRGLKRMAAAVDEDR
jgi:hypothetical protein